MIMNESIKNLLERRSIRAYKKNLFRKKHLDTILEAGKYSPSGMGQQEHSYGSDTGSGAGCEAFQNERS